MRLRITALLTAALVLAALPQEANACFDTYLFMQGRGMVYPYKMLALDGSGEYVISNLRGAEPDRFSGNLNVYYGLARGMSVQAVLTSSEKERSHFGFDEWGVRTVYSVLEQHRGIYNLDFIFECHAATNEGTSRYEFSAPSIWHSSRFTLVAHPVAAFGRDSKLALRGHCGSFYQTVSGALVGLGAEYESAQSSSNLGRRLVKGEAGTSLFLGAQVSRNLYLQNELIKGWGAGAGRGDVGYAVTLKVLMPKGS